MTRAGPPQASAGEGRGSVTPLTNVLVNLLGLVSISFAPVAILAIARHFVRRASMRHRPGEPP